MKIYTETTGSGDDIVLLHAWTQDSHSMLPIKELLSTKYRVTTIDLPGAGQSEWSADINSINDAVEKLLPFLPEKATYIGWSWGGFVSMALAADHPERVKRVIGIGIAPKLIEGDDWPGIPQPGFSAIMSADSEEELAAFVKAFYADEFGDEPIAPQLLDHLAENGAPMSVEVWRKGLSICDHTDLRADVSNMACPIDFIWGTDDITNALDSNKVQALNPNLKLHMIDGAKHLPMWTHPEAFNKILLTILAD